MAEVSVVHASQRKPAWVITEVLRLKVHMGRAGCRKIADTFYTDTSGRQQMALGILDHGSRLVTCLHTLVNKRSWTLLGYLCLAIGRHGRTGVSSACLEP